METTHTNQGWLPAAWARRYLAAEVLSTACALLAAWAAYALTESVLLAAAANTASGSLSFYAVMLARALRGRPARDLPAVLRDLLVEFGPSEALDTLLVRPGLIALGMALCPSPAVGVFLGKLAADLCFYAPAILSYELLRRRAPARPRGPLAGRAAA